MTRRSALLARLALATLLVAGQAFAQAAPPSPPSTKPPPPTQADLQEAARQSEVGNRLFNMGVYETAVTHFQKAYELARKPADLQKVADSYKALGQTGPAYDAYTRLLATHGPALGFAGAVAVKKAIAELETSTGTLDVHSTPDGAVVRAGERVLGVTPFAAPVRLATAALRIEVTKDGYEPYVTNVAIDPTHPAKVEATLVGRVLTGHLTVKEAHSAQAHLMVDGLDVGALPWEGDVQPGVHQLALQATNLKADPQTVKVSRGSRTEATFSADVTAASLKVSAHPDAADIALDGKSIGTGKFEGNVAVGDHSLHIAAPGYKPVDRPITIAADKPMDVEITLERVISDAEIAAAQAARDAEAIRGGYGQVTVFGAWPPLSTHLDCQDTTANTRSISDTCSTGFVYGGGATLRGGYSWGIFGLEVVGAFMFNRWEDDAAYTPTVINPPAPMTPTLGGYPHSEAYTFTAMGGMIAAGPRLMTAGHTFRLTIGAAGGLSIRNIQLDRSLSNGVSDSSSAYSGSVVAIAPGMLADVGFILGSTPGINFVFGGMAWIDFPSQTQVSASNIQETANGTNFNAPTGPFTVVSGPQVFIGPYLGIRFGH